MSEDEIWVCHHKPENKQLPVQLSHIAQLYNWVHPLHSPDFILSNRHLFPKLWKIIDIWLKELLKIMIAWLQEQAGDCYNIGWN